MSFRDLARLRRYAGNPSAFEKGGNGMMGAKREKDIYLIRYDTQRYILRERERYNGVCMYVCVCVFVS